MTKTNLKDTPSNSALAHVRSTSHIHTYDSPVFLIDRQRKLSRIASFEVRSTYVVGESD